MSPDKKRTLIDIDPITESGASPYADTSPENGEDTMDEDTESFFSEDRPPIHVDGV